MRGVGIMRSSVIVEFPLFDNYQFINTFVLYIYSTPDKSDSQGTGKNV